MFGSGAIRRFQVGVRPTLEESEEAPLRTPQTDIPGLTRVTTRFVNAWLVDAPGGWVLVDTGLPGYAGRIVQHAERRYGAGTRPHAIVLTHGHLDHAGSAARLSTLWDVPVFAHRRELPFLDGRSAYPPVDPSLGGPLAALARALPTRGADLMPRLRPLPLDGRVPCLPGWRWLRTPGHTPGHVALFRLRDRTLVAGDALCTVDLDAWLSQLHWRHPRISRPPRAFTMDWETARASLHALSGLEPRSLAAGHGLPMTGPVVAEQLLRLAADFLLPDAHGARAVPALGAAVLGALAVGAGLAFRSLRRAAPA